jgi:hypothetical protein
MYQHGISLKRFEINPKKTKRISRTAFPEKSGGFYYNIVGIHYMV